MIENPVQTPLVFTQEMWIATGILVGAYLLIFSEVLHRASAAVIGAVVMVGIGMATDFYTQEGAISAIDGNTLLLLLAMMMLVALLRPTGGLEYIGIKLAKLSGGSPRKLLVYLCLATSVISMFLDNVTTVLIFAPLTVLITRMLDLNPAPFLMGEAMLSNIGGISTLVGDPTTIMIGSAAGIDFIAFLIHMLPMVVPAWITTVLLLLFLFRHELRPLQENAAKYMDLDESKAISNPACLKRVALVLAIVIMLFFIHHKLHLFPAYVAWIGVAIAMLISGSRPEQMFTDVEWSVLLFFAALFIIVGGVDASGMLDLLGHALAEQARNPETLLLSGLMVIWVAALLSAIVDNIPITITMLPIFSGLQTQGIDVTPLWWALAIGVGLGGNVTHIGATANIICISEAERSGHPQARISPLQWFRAGLPVLLASLIAVSLVYAMFFGWFR